VSDETARALEREFGCKVETVRAGCYRIALSDGATVQTTARTTGKWDVAAWGRDDLRHNPVAVEMCIEGAPLGTFATPTKAVRAALGAMDAAWEKAEAERKAVAPTVNAIKRAIRMGDASPAARALNLAGIRRASDVPPWTATQSRELPFVATVGGLPLGLCAMVNDKGGRYFADLILCYHRNVSDDPVDGSIPVTQEADFTHADPIVALHGAIVAMLAKMERPAPTCDRVKCLTEARDNMARWLPGAAPTAEGTDP
jgi:hypothetical protein